MSAFPYDVYHYAPGQGPVGGPGVPPGYPAYAIYGMPGGERPAPDAFTVPPPGYYAAPQPPHAYDPSRGMGPQWAYYAPPAPPAQQMTPQRGAGGFFNFGNQRFMTGLLVGAAATYLLTNDTVQKAMITTAVRLWLGVQGGFAELRERFRDAEAEILAEE